MPSKHRILEFLKRDELLTIADAFDFESANQRKWETCLEAVATSYVATLEYALGELRRDSLKRICQGLGLDDRGRVVRWGYHRLTGQLWWSITK